MTSNEGLLELRRKLTDLGCDAILVAMNNFFGNFQGKLSEIARISGFTGSNGRAVISMDKALLSVDGRYTKQAMEQTDPGLWEIKGYPEFDAIALIKEVVSSGQTLAISSFSITYKSYLSILDLSKKMDFSIRLLDRFPIFSPESADKKIYLMAEADSGDLRKTRIDRLSDTLADGEALLLSDAAAIGWAFGVRCAPTDDKCVLPNCVGIIRKSEKAVLFSDLELQDKTDNFEFFNISEFEDVISKFEKHVVTLDYSRTCLYFPEVLLRNGFSVKQAKTNYGMFEAVKNSTEITNMRKASEKASLSFIRTLAFVDSVADSSEVAISDYFENDLKQYSDFVSLSFNSISAFGKSTSIVHYNPNVCGNSAISSDGLFLFDAGAHFRTATTDMTRTIYRGDNPPEDIKVIYSAVLRSIIIFSSMRFPDNSKACYLDSIARFFIWNKGYDYHFGTGHGVGSFGNVHEHPRISPTSLEKITKDMVITVEPGIYRDDFGIRMENMLLTKQSSKVGFIEFETLSFIPFCRKLIIKEMFSNFELEWLNRYHKAVYDKFANDLVDDEVTFNWLKENTREI